MDIEPGVFVGDSDKGPRAITVPIGMSLEFPLSKYNLLFDLIINIRHDLLF
jgi:hypothetical protein